jgi:excisionase family DNA binding protein
MTKSVLQIQETTAEDFTNEILLGVKTMLESFANSTQGKEANVLLTREEAAKMLSVSLVTLWDWTRKDLIPAYRIGNRVRYKKNEVLESLNKMNNFKNQSKII